ncbi:MAG: carbamoyl-phosphate synthase large subunit [Candidatus Jacksonbacteria bacterium]|nr:carbamoyl-phosphate synthase large subunit [Candidatus Jacksonbacteria bacterium]
MTLQKPKKVLLLGSGALKIGEAGEFDYSGSQAIKALKEEGIKTVVVNPNIATYQTSSGLADRVYFLPVNPHFVSRIIKKENPDGIMLSFGGQTALNCGLGLYKHGFIGERKKPLILGTPISAVEKTEDRAMFVETLKCLNLLAPKSEASATVEAAKRSAREIGYPIIIRSGYSLGGEGSGLAANDQELEQCASVALARAPQILVEENLTGWKEIEYEVVRDEKDNCITVCNMENMDPMGVHTGESIVVAPSQTLTNEEYHGLRAIAIKLIRHLKIVGECNVQFALNTKTQNHNAKLKIKKQFNNGTIEQWNYIDYRIIEVNARLSRSSALASKATGYPLAFVAAKLAIGLTLPEIKNAITKKTTCFFEPALDYVVVKMPRWDTDKFQRANRAIGSEMKSVGEVMAIGRNFEEALQKASRMLGLDQTGIIASVERLAQKYPHLAQSLVSLSSRRPLRFLADLIKHPNEHRVLAIVEALKRGVSPEIIAKWSSIDLWFIYKMKNITDGMEILKNAPCLTPKLVHKAKRIGFSDKQIALLSNKTEDEIYCFRKERGISASVNNIDTLAAEYPAKTNYLYCTYGESAGGKLYPKASGRGKKIMILGSGVYRIGSSVEFDWCAVSCGETLRRLGYKTIMINHNPETVSTDYDMADSLYFEELSFESVRGIYEIEKPFGIILSMGGQTPNNIALKCKSSGMRILGTDPTDIDRAEDRYKFSKLLHQLSIDQPRWKEFTNENDARKFAQMVGYPVLIRPSYVLSGAAMNIAFNNDDLKEYMDEAANLSPEHPVVITKFIVGAKEIEVDAVAHKGEVLSDIISEHVENAGVHSGDATIVCPPQKLYIETIRRVKEITRAIAKALSITGPFNIQLLAKDNEIKVIECNLRASRSFPFVSKVTGNNLIETATFAILSKKRLLGKKYLKKTNIFDLPYVGVKAPQFSFSRIKGADPVLRVEMASTGEVGSMDAILEAAYLKSILATGFHFPKKGVLLSLGGETNKQKFLDSARALAESGFIVYATHHTAEFLSGLGISARRLYKLHEYPREPNIRGYLLKKEIDLVIVINDFDYKKPVKTSSYEVDDDYELRRTAADLNVPILTNLQTARLFVKALSLYPKIDMLDVRAWDSYVHE